MPIVLGSLPSFAVMLIYIPIINARIKNEEKLLADGLEGPAIHLVMTESLIIFEAIS